MTTIDATISIMRELSENDRRKVFIYAQKLKSPDKIDNPFVSLDTKQILADLDQSEKEFVEGKELDAEKAINSLRR